MTSRVSFLIMSSSLFTFDSDLNYLHLKILDLTFLSKYNHANPQPVPSCRNRWKTMLQKSNPPRLLIGFISP